MEKLTAEKRSEVSKKLSTC